jgi:hypothetical protein
MQGPEGKAKMTRKQRAEIVDRILDRYEHLGELVVGDDESLGRLLAALEIDVEDPKIGEFLSSFLIG